MRSGFHCFHPPVLRSDHPECAPLPASSVLIACRIRTACPSTWLPRSSLLTSTTRCPPGATSGEVARQPAVVWGGGIGANGVRDRCCHCWLPHTPPCRKHVVLQTARQIQSRYLCTVGLVEACTSVWPSALCPRRRYRENLASLQRLVLFLFEDDDMGEGMAATWGAVGTIHRLCG